MVATLLLLAQACSVKKDSFTSRSYHNLTARFNGYFNGNEKVKEAVAGFEQNYPYDYDNVLPIFVYADEEESKSLYPEMKLAIEKCSRVISRHSMKIKGKERCRWIDDNYFVIGKANFYMRNFLEAERLFGHTARTYKEEPRSKEATLWMARTYIEMERYSKARNMLTILKEEKEDLPKKFPLNELAAVEAHMNMRQGKTDHAIERLEEAVYLTKRKKDKARWAYILAQLYLHKGQNDRAIQQFQRVVRMNPPYEMEFYARINQALSFEGADSKGVRKMLEKMLKDEKNIEYYDQVWYALADIEYKEGFKDLAIEDLKTSARVSTVNTKQKGKSYMRLADIYFEDRMYREAQVYYDSTVAFLPADHPDYESVANKAEVLTELVQYVETVITEDSLQALGQLDEAELEKRINKMISARKAEEEEKERLELEAREAQVSANSPKKPSNSSGSKGEWYFYNPSTLGKGFSEFAKTWGNRPLEDDWRRKDKSQTLAFEEGEEEEQELAEGEKAEPEWAKTDFYTKDIPKNAADIEASNARIADALYKSGLLYKERLNDNDNAIESFENLNARFDSCQYTLESYYQLYRMYLYKEENENYFSPEMKNSSGWYKDILLYDYPNSEYALLIKDPNRLAKAELEYKEQEKAYREVFRDFKNRQYIRTISSCNAVINDGEANAFLKKYWFLRALSYGGLSDRNNYRTELESIVANFPNTDEATEAQRLLSGLARREEEMSQKPADKVDSELPPVEESAYIFDPNNEHFFALIFPKSDGSVNNVKTKISNFNRQYFSDINLSISNSYIDQDNQIVLVRTLSNKVKAMDYYSTFKSNQDLLKEVNEKEYSIFAISPDNYATLFKNKDLQAYTAFFESKYLN